MSPPGSCRWAMAGEDSAGRAMAKLVKREAKGREIATLLTPREIEVVRMVAKGFTTRKSAHPCIAEGTVKIHLHNIYEKLNINRRAEPARFADDFGLVRRFALLRYGTNNVSPLAPARPGARPAEQSPAPADPDQGRRPGDGRTDDRAGHQRPPGLSIVLRPPTLTPGDIVRITLAGTPGSPDEVTSQAPRRPHRPRPRRLSSSVSSSSNSELS